MNKLTIIFYRLTLMDATQNNQFVSLRLGFPGGGNIVCAFWWVELSQSAKTPLKGLQIVPKPAPTDSVADLKTGSLQQPGVVWGTLCKIVRKHPVVHFATFPHKILNKTLIQLPALRNSVMRDLYVNTSSGRSYSPCVDLHTQMSLPNAKVCSETKIATFTLKNVLKY